MEDEINNPFYDELGQINIIDLLAFVDIQSDFMMAFQHIKPHRSQKNKNNKYILACIIANATSLGINKMAESAKLSYDTLFNIEKSHITLENLHEANEMITNKMTQLPLFNHYNVLKNIIHGSSDGQKFDTRLQTFISRYLRKYFKEKGVSAYTLSVNHASVRTEIITGHESHHLYDILRNNTSAIQPDIVSTDTEGANQVNFAFLDLKNILFAPCYKTITSKAKVIGSFKNTKYQSNDVIKPSEIFDENLIIQEWENIQKIFTAMLSGEASQSTIIKKLSSHKRKNKTKEALWEYNNILMSIYLLFYIDNANFRRCVRISLNRGEAYHQLRRAIANVSGGAFRGKSEMEIRIWNECSRLVCNAIIYYNASMLSQVLEIKEKEGNEQAIEFLKRISPVAWQHINFLGMYDFNKINSIDIEKIVATMLSQLNLELSKVKIKKA
jgi:TnpA family transposase